MKKTLTLCIAVITLNLTGCSTVGHFFGGLWPRGHESLQDRQSEKILQSHIQQCEQGKVAEDCIRAGSIYELRGGDNDARAMDFYRKALALNSPEAPQAIGHLYENGYGVTQSYREAHRWYEKGAQAGDGNAMLYLANMYRFGRGVDRNSRKALQYARQGCKKGNILACATQKELQKKVRKNPA
ncbi:tetratricopeptide repeat protein [Tatumella ptyseos]|uniref:tetratricopeptide repeat protein n=1 Tax=Tatumella ptyseos TaxID=82987 RepID=UPI0023F4C866|nr:tetratricopeptide repeat protein [Tatumella ptyseos]